MAAIYLCIVEEKRFAARSKKRDKMTARPALQVFTRHESFERVLGNETECHKNRQADLD